MNEDHRAEIRASVGAHADLGPGYDSAIAEGLVERIGDEIDKRINARLGASPAASYQAPAVPAPASAPAPAPASGSNVVRHAPTPPWVILGSMALGVGATAVVTSQSGMAVVGKTFMVALIWLCIAIVNIAWSRRR